MRCSSSSYLFAAALCVVASPSLANVTISNGATTNMTCASGVCVPTAAEAVLNVQDLEALLASGNATVKTTGSGVQAADIDVNAQLTWSAATTLALDAHRSIEVNAKISVAGSGGVSLATSDSGSHGEFACNGKGRIEFTNLSSALTINGTRYVLVDSVASLVSAIAANSSNPGAYALARNYNAKKDGIYSAAPVATPFEGSFNGLGNAISNLSINDPTENANVGFFAQTGAIIANVRFVNESVQAASGSYVGGLVGNGGAVIANSFTSGTVSGPGSYYAGGLVGNGAGDFTKSGSSAAVSGGTAGGLIGNTYGGLISDSWASGNVSGNVWAGGLVGSSDSTIKHSWASGQVSGLGYGGFNAAGGLVGQIIVGSVERSHASGAVTCLEACGGLAGYLDNVGNIKISQSYATGSVTAPTNRGGSAGGLVGSGQPCETCEIVDCYASGAVSGWEGGGLVGENGDGLYHPSISTSYATGAINVTMLGWKTWAGGLIGADNLGYPDTKHSYWDVTTSGISNRSQGAGNIANDHGIKGLTNKQLKSGLPKGFNPAIWKEDSSINNGWPYLIANPPPK